MKHKFQPGKVEPFHCAYKMSIKNPNGEVEWISCNKSSYDPIHGYGEDKMWTSEWRPGEEKPKIIY